MSNPIVKVHRGIYLKLMFYSTVALKHVIVVDVDSTFFPTYFLDNSENG